MTKQQILDLAELFKKENISSFVPIYSAQQIEKRQAFIEDLLLKEDTTAIDVLLKSVPLWLKQEALRQITPKCFDLDSVKLLTFVLEHITSNDEDFFLASVKKKANRICQYYLDKASISTKNNYCLWLQNNITNKEFGKTCQELICKIEFQEINSNLTKPHLSTQIESKAVLKI